jgi:hypothetical protein
MKPRIHNVAKAQVADLAEDAELQPPPTRDASRPLALALSRR